MIEALEAAILSKDNNRLRQVIAALRDQSKSVHALVPLINLALKNNLFDLSLECFEKAVLNGLPEQQVTRFIKEPFFNHRTGLAKDFLTIANRHYKKSITINVELIKQTMAMDDFNEAIELLNQTLSSNPHPDLLLLLSDCYFKKCDFHSAKAAILLACELSPNNIQYMLRLATIEKLLHHFPASAGLLGKIITLDSNNHRAHVNLAHLALFSGEFDLGWKEYEWRGRTEHWVPPLPAWEGEQSDSYHLLVWSHNDLSEQILLLPLISRLTPIITLKIAPQLTEILQENKKDVSFLDINYTGDYSEFDGHIPLESLAKSFINCFSDIPTVRDWLFSNLSKQSILNKAKLKVGFSWVGNATHDNIPQTLKLEFWQHLLGDSDCQYIAFENSICPDDQLLLKAQNIATVGFEDCKNLTLVANQLSELDLFLTVDNHMAHLAGALGISTIVFLPKISNWYWFSSDVQSHWYPSIELSRILPTINCSGLTPNTKKAIQNWQKDSQLQVNNKLKELTHANCDSITTRTAS